MRAFRFILIAVLAFLLATVFSGCGKKAYPPELMEAKAAVAESKAEGAADKCPEEFHSAETMLVKAEAFYADNDEKQMSDAAKSTIQLADAAKDCAAKKAPVAPTTLLSSELPKELADMKEDILFAFNDNSITASEAAKLTKVAELIKQYQDKNKFWIVLTSSTDSPGDPKENFELSKRRGVVVRGFLNAHGVNADLVLIKPVGESYAAKLGKKDARDPSLRKVVVAAVPYGSIESIKIGNPFIFEKAAPQPETSKK